MSTKFMAAGGLPEEFPNGKIPFAASRSMPRVVDTAHRTDYGTNSLDTMESLFDGGHIERYHVKGQRMLTRQSVAEHSWRMACIVFAINPRPSAALVLATLFHDVSERVTGDMPANVKRANPAIEQAVHEVSTAEEVRLGIRFDLNEEEAKLLGWADRFEGGTHCWQEFQMGNRLIFPTLRRYQSYYVNSKYKLADEKQESNRRMLMDYLNQRIQKEIES